MIHPDLFEQLAIERRRKNEEERKKRIFDPKMRIKGVDFAAIPEQIKEKIERKTVEKERDHLFDLQCSEINQLLEKIDQEIKQRKVRESYKLNEFRKSQKGEDCLTPRVKIDSENPHASNCQTFVGDDLEKLERTKKQHEQMKVWVMQQVWEREENKRKEKEEELAFKEYQDQLIQSLEDIEMRRTELLRERNKRDAEHNLRLAAFKKERDYHEMEDRYFGHIQIMNQSKLGDLIFETPLSKKRNGQPMVSEYKGMTEEEISEIRTHQLKQKQEREERERKEREEEFDYAEYQKRVTELQNLLDIKKQEIVKEQNRLQNQVNEMLRGEYQSEVLYEDEEFSYRNLAALVASKIYYYLGEYEESLNFALGAGNLFDLTQKTQYTETIIAQCIDKYVEMRIAKLDNSQDVTIDSRMENIVKRMFSRCFDDKEFKQAIGIAVESRRLDMIEKAIAKGKPQHELLSYVLNASMNVVEHLEFKNQVLRLLVKLYNTLEKPDYISISQCLMHLNDSDSCATMLKKLVSEDNDTHLLIAYQIAFDVDSNATQEFRQKVYNAIPDIQPSQPAASSTSNLDAMDTDEKEPLLQAEPADPHALAHSKLRSILSGEVAIKLYLEFLYRNNHTDFLILKNSKLIESNSSMYHSAITFANAFMSAGTTSDEFLRSNLNWLAKANNWAKFSATAALGVIHKGQIANGQSLLAPYLPRDGVSGSVYQEGGALYALGLIHANHGSGVLDYLTNALKNTQDETVQHGASLGIGVAGMATDNATIYEQLKGILFTDSAIAGEAAGLAMGLVMLGTASETAITDMIQYAHETQHEKIIRGLALGIAMIMYGKEDEADTLIEQLITDKDPILRYGGMYAIAMAYSGTGSNRAIRKLLHCAVSDTNDDVRRAAVTALGFILFKTPERVPKVVQLLAESYNPYVRYGACLALGIACAGTGLSSAVELLEPMTKDNVDFVRQGAFISLAMLFVQHNDVQSPKVNTYRELFSNVVKDKKQSAMSKFGATLAQGIIDAGGRNVTISLQSRSGYSSMPAIVGMAVFTQFWYWYPLAHFLSLAFTPTALIGLNKNLDMPKFDFVSKIKPSMFAYPPQTKPPTVEVAEKVATAVLSTTQKAKARAKKKEGDAMDTDDKKEEPTPKLETSKEVSTPAPTSTEKKKEDDIEILGNLSRITPSQLRFVQFKKDSRYEPVKKGTLTGGIMIFMDKTPDVNEEVIPYTTPSKKEETKSEENEPEPPEPFEYTE